jgi:hypothetical protein
MKKLNWAEIAAEYQSKSHCHWAFNLLAQGMIASRIPFSVAANSEGLNYLAQPDFVISGRRSTVPCGPGKCMLLLGSWSLTT